VIELSADLGESSRGEDEIWPLIQRANVACGGHAGDEETMREAAGLSMRHAVLLGAHPSYPDREHFGRRSLVIEPAELRESLVAQLSSLRVCATVHHVKPHGALYNDAHRDLGLARIIVEAMRHVDPSLAMVAPDRSEMAAAAREAGLPVIREAFADRRYEPDGSLTPRSIPGSTLTIDETVAQVVLLAREGKVVARDGTRVPIIFDTLCIHADMNGAAGRLRAIRPVLS